MSSAPAPPHLEKKLVELNAELSRYVAENQSLEEEINPLRVQLATKQEEDHPLKEHLAEKEDHVGGMKETQDFLKRIDSKYSLEVLRAVQLGEEHSISIKNFIAHFFYALRKTGLQNYPDVVEFDLGYEESNLYECVGFQVEPGSKKRVKVEKKGWALCRGDQMLTVRKAVVRLSS